MTAPAAKPCRVPCVNPRCRRTSAFSADDVEADVICRKCWRALPHPMRARYQQLQRRQRCMLKLIAIRVRQRRISADMIGLLQQRFEASCADNWRNIRGYFAATSERPAGLDGFLREVGL